MDRQITKSVNRIMIIVQYVGDGCCGYGMTLFPVIEK